MPRTALRYAIEHLPQPQRKRALRGFFSWRCRCGATHGRAKTLVQSVVQWCNRPPMSVP